MRKSIKLRKKILRLINDSIKRRGHPPTVRELAKFIKRSPTATHHHLKKLWDSGNIKFRWGDNKRVARGLKIKNAVFDVKFF